MPRRRWPRLPLRIEWSLRDPGASKIMSTGRRLCFCLRQITSTRLHARRTIRGRRSIWVKETSTRDERLFPYGYGNDLQDAPSMSSRDAGRAMFGLSNMEPENGLRSPNISRLREVPAATGTAEPPEDASDLSRAFAIFVINIWLRHPKCRKYERSRMCATSPAWPADPRGDIKEGRNQVDWSLSSRREDQLDHGSHDDAGFRRS